MKDNIVTSERKIENLLRFIKLYQVRNPVTLGIIFNLWNDWELIDKGVFIPNLNSSDDSPVLLLGHDELIDPARLILKGKIYVDQNAILEKLQSVEAYRIYLYFPNNQNPRWHSEICEPSPCEPMAIAVPDGQPAEQKQCQVITEPFKTVYKQALMVLIDSALANRDREKFMILSEEWNQIA